MLDSETVKSNCTHKQNFSSLNSAGERNTAYVLLLTVVTMVAEIVAGTIYGSMALLADGWHMGTHAAAFLITLFAYRYARKNANSNKFSYGTGKVTVLGGYTSAIALGLVALIMLVESATRILNPQEIFFNQAILVAFIGLTVNIVSVFLLKDHHGHSHSHSHSHGHSHNHSHKDDHSHSHDHDHPHEHAHSHDHNLRAAYFHVLADALTSLLAIIALLMGKYYGLNWLDPLMGIVGGIIISRWAWGLLKQTGPVLLDVSIEQEYIEQIVTVLEAEGAKVADTHIWKVSADHFVASFVIGSTTGQDAAYYKAKIAHFERLSHVTLEVNQLSEAQ